MRFRRSEMLITVSLLAASTLAAGADPEFTSEVDIIYRKQGGYALTMDKVAPLKNSNQASVIFVVSGGWFSSHDLTRPLLQNKIPARISLNVNELLRRGYTVFFVVHGSQPKFTIAEIHEQVSAAVRHIRSHAATHAIDPDRIGIMGASAGGHLSLMQARKAKMASAERMEQRPRVAVSKRW